MNPALRMRITRRARKDFCHDPDGVVEYRVNQNTNTVYTVYGAWLRVDGRPEFVGVYETRQEAINAIDEASRPYDDEVAIIDAQHVLDAIRGSTQWDVQPEIVRQTACMTYSRYRNALAELRSLGYDVRTSRRLERRQEEIAAARDRRIRRAATKSTARPCDAYLDPPPDDDEPIDGDEPAKPGQPRITRQEAEAAIEALFESRRQAWPVPETSRNATRDAIAKMRAAWRKGDSTAMIRAVYSGARPHC